MAWICCSAKTTPLLMVRLCFEAVTMEPSTKIVQVLEFLPRISRNISETPIMRIWRL